MDDRDLESTVSAPEVFAAALRLGLTSFGGPIAHIGHFRREYVVRRGWLDELAFADLVARCQSLPGPASSQLGVAIGTRRAGLAGGAAAWLGFTLPSAIVLTILGLLANTVDVSGTGWVHGLKLAAVAIVVQALYGMAKTLATDLPRRIIAVAAAVVALAWATPFSQVAIIAGGAGIGWLVLSPPPVTWTPSVTRVVSRRTGLLALGAFVALLVIVPLARAADGQLAAIAGVAG